MNIYAYTEATLAQYPGFISVNTPSDNAFERVEVTVRTRGDPYGSKIELTHKECKELVEKLTKYMALTHAERLANGGEL